MKTKKIVKKIIKCICVPVKNIMLLFFYLFFKIFCKGEFQGESVIRRNLKTGFIIVANHVSYLDWLVLIPYFLFKHKISVTWFAKKKLYRHPVWAPILHGSDFIQVSDNGKRILSFSLRTIKSRRFFGIFPEGTRSYSGNGEKPKAGLIGLMKLTGLPVITKVLNGFYEIWPRNKKLPTPGKGIVRFCDEIRYDDLNLKHKGNEEKQREVVKIMSLIKKENKRINKEIKLKEKRVIAILGIDGSGKSSTSRMVSQELSSHTPVGCSSDRLYLYENNILSEVYHSFIEKIRLFFHRIAKKCKSLEAYKVPKITELILRNHIVKKFLAKNSKNLFVLDGSPLLNIVAWNIIFKKNLNRKAYSTAIKLLSGNGEKMVIKEKIRKCLISELFWIKRFKVNKLIIPDIVVLLDIKPETALQRINRRNENKQTHETKLHLSYLKQGYHLVCSILKTEWKIPVFIVDASIEQKSVVNNILNSIDSIINR